MKNFAAFATSNDVGDSQRLKRVIDLEISGKGMNEFLSKFMPDPIHLIASSAGYSMRARPGESPLRRNRVFVLETCRSSGTDIA